GRAQGGLLLVDPREPNEPEIERYPEALYLPMSEFDPAEIPDPQGRRVVFARRSGNRSGTASLIAQAAGLPYDAHLAGGIKTWKALGLPTASWSLPTKQLAGHPAPLNARDRIHASIDMPCARRRGDRGDVGRRAGEEGPDRQRLQLVGLYRARDRRGFQQGDGNRGPLRHFRFQRYVGGQAP